MFINVENAIFQGIFNSKKITTIEVDRDTTLEINYLFSDGAIVKEIFENEDETFAKMQKIEKDSNFIATNDNRLVNPLYISNVKKDIINPNRIIIFLYGGAPVKELYGSEELANIAYEEIKKKLEAMTDERIDINEYVKIEDAEKEFAQGSDVPTKVGQLINDTGFITESDIPTIPTKVSQLTNDKLYVTNSEMEKRIKQIVPLVSFDLYPSLVTNKTTSEFFNSVIALNLPTGSMLLGATRLTDISNVASGMMNEEMRVEIYPNNVIHGTMTSTDIEPYEWTIQYMKGKTNKWIPRVIR